MAITFKSQGAGVSTETSGAALSPLCPATVDAGDILIAHVMWEGTTTSPNTPSGWTLLDGPRDLGTTVVARHWVFGKIADGTEDGAAVAFGSPAVTTQRGARVYSFGGRVGGTITELVNGFANTVHATDPQMPTVTTTIAGALAVALVAQNDNNTVDSATGESGGDWVEAVAEYTAALTPGLMLQIQTATPTADPGTISGGSAATANDPCGVIGFQIKQSANQEVTPGAATLTLTPFAPTVTASDNKEVTPGAASLSLTAFAPTVSVGADVDVTPGAASLALTAFAPTVSVSDNISVTPGAASLTATPFAPTVTTTNNVSVTPGAASLSLTAFAPTVTVSDNISVTPGVASLSVTAFAPTVAVSDNVAVTPGAASLTLTAFAATVSVTANVNVTPGFASLTITAFAPTVSTSGNVEVTPGVASLSLTAFAPTVAASGGGWTGDYWHCRRAVLSSGRRRGPAY